MQNQKIILGYGTDCYLQLGSNPDGAIYACIVGLSASDNGDCRPILAILSQSEFKELLPYIYGELADSQVLGKKIDEVVDKSTESVHFESLLD